MQKTLRFCLLCGQIVAAPGGLMLLEGSHRCREQLQRYWNSDVEARCTNVPPEAGKPHATGQINGTAAQISNALGGRFVTADY